MAEPQATTNFKVLPNGNGGSFMTNYYKVHFRFSFPSRSLRY